jgi:hypothetical protein
VSAPVGFDNARSAEHSQAAGEGFHLIYGEGMVEFNGIGTPGHNLRSVA